MPPGRLWFVYTAAHRRRTSSTSAAGAALVGQIIHVYTYCGPCLCADVFGPTCAIVGPEPILDPSRHGTPAEFGPLRLPAADPRAIMIRIRVVHRVSMVTRLCYREARANFDPQSPRNSHGIRAITNACRGTRAIMIHIRAGASGWTP